MAIYMRLERRRSALGRYDLASYGAVVRPACNYSSSHCLLLARALLRN